MCTYNRTDPRRFAKKEKQKRPSLDTTHVVPTTMAPAHHRQATADRLLEKVLHAVYSGGSSRGVTSSSSSRLKFVVAAQRHELAQQVAASSEDDCNNDSGCLPLDIVVLENDNDCCRFQFSKPPSLHWTWRSQDDGNNGCDEAADEAERLCLSLLAPDGGVWSFSSSSDDDVNVNDASNNGPQSTLFCRISNLQWTLETTTSSTASDDDEISTFWKASSIQFWKQTSFDENSVDGPFPAAAQQEEEEEKKSKDDEETNIRKDVEKQLLLLLDCRDVTLIGALSCSGDDDNAKRLQLEPRSMLQLKAGHGQEHVEEMEDALFDLWSKLDGLGVLLPDLLLTLTHVLPQASAEQVPPAFESTETTTLGDVLQYYLTNYLSSTSPNGNQDSTSPLTASMVLPPTWHVASAMPSTTSSPAVNNGDAAAAPTTTSHSSSVPSRPALRHRLSKRISQTTAKINLGDSVAATSALVATGSSFISPIGAAVSIAALAAKDGVVAVAQKGKQVRLSEHRNHQEETNDDEEVSFDDVVEAGERTIDSSAERQSNDAVVSEKEQSERYKFGDVTRGVIASFRERKHQQQQQRQTVSDDVPFLSDPVDLDIRPSPGYGARTSRVALQSSTTSESSSSTPASSYLKANEGRFVGVVGASAGAGFGLLVGGPIGAVAGSVAGSLGSQAALRRRQHQSMSSSNSNISDAIGGKDEDKAGNNTLSSSFRLGDNIRNVVVRGKEATGRDVDAPFRVGDFANGLSGSLGFGNDPSSSQSTVATSVASEEETTDSANSISKQPFRLGDNVRGILSRGKAATEDVVAQGKTVSGRSKESKYKFGDFSRGLMDSYKKKHAANNNGLSDASVPRSEIESESVAASSSS